jgi:hypothetical protein
MKTPSWYGRLSAVFVSSLTACGGAPGTDDTDGVAVYSACAFQERTVEYCGATTPLTDWTPGCYDEPCPSRFDDGEISTPDVAGGGFCSQMNEYRNVIDIQTTCAQWQSAGEPFGYPSGLYCGASLLYNEFDDSTGIENVNACRSCLTSHCSSLAAQCFPQQGAGRPRCDELIRLCAQKCPLYDNVATDCAEYADVLPLANSFYLCSVEWCADVCD